MKVLLPSAAISRIIVLAMGLSLLQACGSLKLGYNGAPTLSYWWLDRYLDFDRDQAGRVRDGLGELARWHRQTQLPAYAQLVQETQALAAQPQITPAQTCAVLDDAERQIATLASEAVQRAVPVALTITPEQLAHMETRYAKLNAEYRDEWITPPQDKVREKRYEKALDRAEKIYGRLDAPQRTVLREQMDGAGFDARLVDAERRRRQQDTLQTLRAVAGATSGTPTTPEQAERQLAALVERWRNSPQPQYRSYAQRQTEQNCASVALLHNAATPEQQARAVQKLKDYERELRELSAQR